MKTRIFTIVAVILVIASVGVLLLRSTPKIVVFVNGKPASNLQIRELGGTVVATTDRDGVANKSAGVKPDSLVGFSPPAGGFQSLSFPPYGRREYRFNGGTTTVTWHKIDFGIIFSKTETTTVSFTEEETRQLEAGERTFEDFQAKP